MQGLRKTTSEPDQLGQKRDLRPILAVTGATSVIGAVVVAVILFLDHLAHGPGPGPYRVTATVSVGKPPADVAVDLETHTVYVANGETGSR